MSSYYDSELDRKSSRGMIYENEELRLRTININAEVERGQSDIKRLRRENEQLRREIWTLRDECDRLNKRFKAKLIDHEHGGVARGSGGSSGCAARGSGSGGGCPAGGGCDGMHSRSNSDDSDSCDTCRGDDDQCSDNCSCHDSRSSPPPKTSSLDAPAESPSTADRRLPGNGSPCHSNGDGCGNSEAAQGNFDHLSVVSEETLSNSEVQHQQQPNQLYAQYSSDSHGSQMTVPSGMGSITPLTPIELVANQLNDLTAMVPPLSYFENILQQHMGSNIGSTPETTSLSAGGKVIRHTNGWDYNMESPFAQRKLQSSSSSPSSGNSRGTVIHQQQSYAPPTLTTFAPASTQPTPLTLAPPPFRTSSSAATPTIETVAITTMPANPGGAAPNGSPKHFFAPLKPRLKLNTSLANKTLIAATVPVVPTTSSPHLHCDPPDLYVANALASPYQRQALPTITVGGGHAQPASVNSSQVSPRHRHHHRHHVHHLQHHLVSPQSSPQRNEITIVVVDVDAPPAVCSGSGAATPGGLLDTAPNNISFQTPHLQHSAATQAPSPPPPSLPLQSLPLGHSNTYFTQINEPIYATAQKCCKKLISATAVTMPLMTATTDTARLSPFPAGPSPQLTRTVATSLAMATLSRTSEVQTDSVNLETILNDIETISEDILAIQLEKGKSRENLHGITASASSTEFARPLQPEDKNKKPYRSEMNLQLTYDGTNSSITPTQSSAAMTNAVADSAMRPRTRSLERDLTESPSPNVPDPMAPFPANRTYIGFDQVNKAAASAATAPPGTPTIQLQKPPLPPTKPQPPGTPPRSTPPLPPTRKFSPPFLIHSAAGVTRITPVGTPTHESSPHGLSPNKSHLFAAIANAAAKRAQFRSAESHATKSLDMDFPNEQRPNGFDSPTHESSEAAEAARRKARRVSIVCGSPNGCTSSEPNVSQTPLPAETSTTGSVYGAMAVPQSGSCTDLSAMAENPTVRSLKQTSHSTPNSPHSARRRSNSNGGLALGGGDGHPLPTSPLAAAPTTSAHQNHTAAHNTHSHGHGHSQSQGVLSVGGQQHQHTASQDSTRDLASAAAAAAVVARSKCSRRHSDGTVVGGVQRISGASSGGHHHHHHHHQHQHSSVISSNPHHSHHSRQDSNHETATSGSDRNSNSLASSRESSTSFSMRSQRRKISISSHTGGKIPWCGCWGNGCL